MANKDLIDSFKKKDKPLILDGAMGSLLTQNGVEWDDFLWASLANISHPELVVSLHEQYAESGADIITTNTFRTNPVALKRSGNKIGTTEFVKKSVELARKILIKHPSVLIAGSNAPAEDCYQKDKTLGKKEIEHNHKTHIELLYNSGCDFILNETHSHMDEIRIICQFCNSNQIPFVVSLYFTRNLTLLSGEHLSEAVYEISDYSPLAIGLNCVFFDDFKNAVKRFTIESLSGFYLNCGAGAITDKEILCGVPPEDYRRDIKDFITDKTLFIGTCCGSTPAHTKALRELIDEIC